MPLSFGCGWNRLPACFGRQLAGICLAVAVVALRRPRRVQRRNGSHRPLGLREAFAPLDAALLVAARRVLPPSPRGGERDGGRLDGDGAGSQTMKKFALPVVVLVLVAGIVLAQ